MTELSQRGGTIAANCQDMPAMPTFAPADILVTEGSFLSQESFALCYHYFSGEHLLLIVPFITSTLRKTLSSLAVQIEKKVTIKNVIRCVLLISNS